MNESVARRVVLALMSSQTFELVALVTYDVAHGAPVQEDFGFTPAEIRRAVLDRARIAVRYNDLKPKNSFAASEIKARTEFLATVEWADP